MDCEVFAQLLSDGFRPGAMVAVQHPRGVVPRLEGLDRRRCRDVGARQSREDAAAGHGLRLACSIPYHDRVLRLAALPEPEADAARDVEDDLLGPEDVEPLCDI